MVRLEAGVESSSGAIKVDVDLNAEEQKNIDVDVLRSTNTPPGKV
jgi:hypothetical protein